MTEQSIILDYFPRPWQAECHQRSARFSVLVLHRRAGKTELAIMELIDDALRCTRELGLFFYVAPMLKQAKSIAWARLKQKLRPILISGGCTLNEADLSATFTHNGACIRLFGADNPDAIRGVRLDGVVVDEVAQIKPEVWEDILQPALSDRLGWALFIGTPRGVNLFSQLYYRAKAGTPGWHAALWTVHDTDALDPAEVERLRTGGMPENSFAREYLCDFTASGDDQLISLSDTHLSASRSYAMRDIAESPKIIGVDPARFGDDRSVVVRRQGLQMLPPLVLKGVDNMTLAGRVAGIMQDWDPDAVFVDAGHGAGVIDRLRQLGFQCHEVPFGSTALRADQFNNRRTEMWSLMADWIQQGGAIADDQDLKQELATPTYRFDAQGRRVLESKDEIKKRLQGGSSPDIADALALTFAAPVNRSDRNRAKNSRFDTGVPVKRKRYDPLAGF